MAIIWPVESPGSWSGPISGNGVVGVGNIDEMKASLNTGDVLSL